MTVRIPLFAIFMLVAFALPAAAQSYPQDTGHYLRLPSGYQNSAPPLAAQPRPLFTGNGQQAMMPAPMAAPATAVSNRLLPPEMANGGAMMASPATMQPMAQQPQPMMQQPMQAQPVAAVAPVRALPVASQESAGGQTNVQMRPACDVPANHRAANKGLNTSTTVHGDCLN